MSDIYNLKSNLLRVDTSNMEKFYVSWKGHSTLSDGKISYSFNSALPSYYQNPADYLKIADKFLSGFITGAYEQLAPALQGVSDGLLSTLSNSNYRVSFSDVTKDLRFEKVASGGDVVIMQGDVRPSLGDGFAHMPYESTWGAEGGDVWLSASVGLAGKVNPGQGGFYMVLHELIHAVGLDHPANPQINTMQYTALSYIPQGWKSIINGYAPQGENTLYDSPEPGMLSRGPLRAYGLQLLDVAALQEVYGRNYEMRSSHTTYSLGNGLGRDNDTSKAFIYTIWDGGGQDVIDATNFSDAVKIDLRQGAFSSIGSNGLNKNGFDVDAGREIQNVSIAFYTVIENAIGTAGNDLLIGNAWSNILLGGGGRDIIHGESSTYDNTQEFLGDNDSFKGERGENNAWIDSASEGNKNDILLGGLGDDTLFGGVGNDVLHGGYRQSDVTTGTNTAKFLRKYNQMISYEALRKPVLKRPSCANSKVSTAASKPSTKNTPASTA